MQCIIHISFVCLWLFVRLIFFLACYLFVIEAFVRHTRSHNNSPNWSSLIFYRKTLNDFEQLGFWMLAWLTPLVRISSDPIWMSKGTVAISEEASFLHKIVEFASGFMIKLIRFERMRIDMHCIHDNVQIKWCFELNGSALNRTPEWNYWTVDQKWTNIVSITLSTWDCDQTKWKETNYIICVHVRRQVRVEYTWNTSEYTV